MTGGCGFIGSQFVRSALAEALPGVEVSALTVIDALTYAGNLANLELVSTDPRLRVVRGSITDAQLLAELLVDVDVVVNFAAETHVDRSIDAAAAFVATNVAGAQTLFESVRHSSVRRLVHVSTDEVYGDIEHGSWTEACPLEPNSPYAASKAAADLFARAYAVTHELPVVVTRCSNNYGPFQFPEKVIPLFVTNLLDGIAVPLYGDGRNIRDWLHVEDHCLGIAVALLNGSDGAIYNIGGGTELSNRDLTNRILEALECTWDSVTWVSDRPGHDRRYSVDDTALRALGYTPVRDFDTGLAQTIAWYQQNQAWWRPLVRR